MSIFTAAALAMSQLHSTTASIPKFWCLNVGPSSPNPASRNTGYWHGWKSAAFSPGRWMARAPSANERFCGGQDRYGQPPRV